MPVIFSNFLVSNEMSGYTENNSTTIFIVHELFLSYKLFKVYRNNMDHPVGLIGWVVIKGHISISGNDLVVLLLHSFVRKSC